MKFEQVLELVNAVSNSHLTTFKYENGNETIEMSKVADQTVKVIEMNTAEAHAINTNVMHDKEVSVQAIEDKVIDGNVVLSPLVGTFYTAPSEEAEAFVKVGDVVKKGQILAIVEAMKLMNEIECEFDGTVAEVLVQNGQAVEYGQSLFIIK